MLEARRARLDLGFGLEGPLPDLLEAVEDPAARRSSCSTSATTLPAPICSGPGRAAFVNGAARAGRQRFTLAHEFGHCRLGHASVIDRPADVFGAHATRPRSRRTTSRPSSSCPAGGPALGARATAHASTGRPPRGRVRRQREGGPHSPGDVRGVTCGPRARGATRRRDRRGGPTPRARGLVRLAGHARRAVGGEPAAHAGGSARHRARGRARGRPHGRAGGRAQRPHGRRDASRARRPRARPARADRLEAQRSPLRNSSSTSSPPLVPDGAASASATTSSRRGSSPPPGLRRGTAPVGGGGAERAGALELAPRHAEQARHRVEQAARQAARLELARFELLR